MDIPNGVLATATCSPRPASRTSCGRPSSAAVGAGARSTSPAASTERDFSADDAAALASIAGRGRRRNPSLAALRRGPARRRRHRPPDSSCSARIDDVELITPAARELLAAMRTPAQADDDETPPSPLLALAAFTRSGPHDPDGDPQTVAVPTSSGWITLHASLPDGGTAGRVAIVLERAASPESTAVRLEAHGVTAREREIASLLARGLTNPEIAATAGPLPLHRPRPHQEPLREDRRVLTPGARGTRVPRRLPAPARHPDTA